MFYASKVRAHLGWWKAHHAPRSILRALKHGVKLDFHTLPQPFKLSPLLVDNRDVDFAIADLQKGDSLGAYQPPARTLVREPWFAVCSCFQIYES
jgi:hypothetical protein